MGVSSKAAGSLENRYKFNGGTELNTDFDLSFYETQCRLYDPQIGRFWQVDELAEANWEWTTYNFALNNPISFNDPLGLTEDKPNPDAPVVTRKTNMPEVTVVGKEKKLTHLQVMDFHTRLEKAGIGIDQVKNNTYRRQLERYDNIYKFMANVHAQTREQDILFLKTASWILPGGLLTKLIYVKPAIALLKMKRGGQAALVIAKSAVQGTVRERVLSSGSELASQYITNSAQYGFGGDNFANLNFMSILGNFAMPNNGFGQALFGNSFKATYAGGYGGIGSGASKGYILTNILLDYGGNQVGNRHGNFLGDMLGNSSQTVFDMYYDLNNKR